MRLFFSLLFVLALGTCVRAQCELIQLPGWKSYQPQELTTPKTALDTLLPKVYLEVDYDIVSYFGGPDQARAFILAAFLEVRKLYRRDVVTDPQPILFLHESPSSYVGTNSITSLNEFRLATPSHPGDVAMLLSFRASGGVAYLDQVCRPFNYSFSSIRPTFTPYTVYSWTVEVIAHELGHLFGSQHTQACAWNGNNTPLDGCWTPEGDCARPPLPVAGSVMSYCHLVGGVGIDFLTVGFLDQPSAVMRSRMLASGCVATKPANPTPVECTDNEITVTIFTDLHPRETTWALTDADGDTVAQGGPYAKHQYLSRITDTLCLPAGCYDFTISDAAADGLVSEEHGQGSYLVAWDGETLAEGGQFGSTDLREICIDSAPPNCDYLDLSAHQTYGGGNQDYGATVVLDGGQGLRLIGNTWRAIPYTYTITPNTILEAEFRGGPMGEIHAIGLGVNAVIASRRSFKLGGSQNWGIRDYDVYPPSGAGWYRVQIPVGRYYTGPADRIFFISDNDQPNPTNVSIFKNVRVHEGECSTGALPQVQGQVKEQREPVPDDALVSDLAGRVVGRNGLNTQGLRPGLYILSWETPEGRVARKHLVTH